MSKFSEKIRRLEMLYEQQGKVNEEIAKLKQLLVKDKRELNKPNLLSFRVTNDELKQLFDICENYKLSRSELLHEIVFGEISKLDKDPK